MFCPNCGKDCGEFKFCPECGTQLCLTESKTVEREKEIAFPNPPIGRYKCPDGYLEIGQKSLIICRRPFFKEQKCEIPFDEIARVSFSDGRFSLCGFLCVRDKWNRGIPMITVSDMAIYDRSSVYFPQSSGSVFHPVFEFLQRCVRINNAAEKNESIR